MELNQISERLQARLIKASEAQSLSIDRDNMLYIGRSNDFVLAGVACGLERVAPEDYCKGVTLGLAYIDIPRLGYAICPGFYTLVTNIEAPRLGNQRASVDLIDEDGAICASLVANYLIKSMRIPDDAKGVVRLLASPQLFDPEAPDDDDEFCLGISWECDNGGEICIGFVIDPTPIDPPPQG